MRSLIGNQIVASQGSRSPRWQAGSEVARRQGIGPRRPSTRLAAVLARLVAGGGSALLVRMRAGRRTRRRARARSVDNRAAGDSSAKRPFRSRLVRARVWAPDSAQSSLRSAPARATCIRRKAGQAELLCVVSIVFRPIAGSLNDVRLPVMHQPIDHGGGEGVVDVEDLAPVAESSVRGQHDRSGLVTGGNDLKQQVCSADPPSVCARRRVDSPVRRVMWGSTLLD